MARSAAIRWLGWTISQIEEATCELEADVHHMNTSAENDIEAWEGEGGAPPAPVGVRTSPMSGTVNQVEWAERIKRQVNEAW
jgi:hypothetical protein